MDYSARLRELLIESKISQADFASAASCSEASMSRYLRGVSTYPPITVFMALATKMNVSVDYLLGLTSIPAVRQNSEEFGYIMYDCYSRATDRDKLLVGTILNSYLTEDEVTMHYDLR